MHQETSAGEEIKSSVFTLPDPAADRSDTGRERRQANVSPSFHFRFCQAAAWIWSSFSAAGGDVMEPVSSLLSALKAVDPKAVRQEYSVSARLSPPRKKNPPQLDADLPTLRRWA